MVYSIRLETRMRRKPVPRQDTIVPQEILDRAREVSEAGQLVPLLKCVVCGAPSAPNSAEELCWVCRRLKISAWRESDQQPAAQE